jgi:hypothetical protein
MNCVANVEGDNPFDPAQNEVFIVGFGHFEEDWPAATEALTDDNGDLIYEGSWTGPAGDYDFLVTFFGDDTIWYGQEMLDGESCSNASGRRSVSLKAGEDIWVEVAHGYCDGCPGDGQQCEKVADCAAEGANPCIQPNCVAGICGEQPVAKGTDCLDVSLDVECATAQCNTNGECEVTYLDAGVSCSPGDGAINVCQVYSCDGAGLCTGANEPDGTVCSIAENPCEIQECKAGECQSIADICTDGFSCTYDGCVYGSPSDQCSKTNILECGLTLRFGTWAEFKEYELTEVALNLYGWCNFEYSNAEGHDAEGCNSWGMASEFIWNNYLEDEEVKDYQCFNKYLPFPEHSCDDLNSCTTDECEPDAGGADETTGCTHEPKPVGTSCSGKESCFTSGDNDPYPGICAVDQESPGVKCVPEDSSTFEECSFNTSPCVTSTCNPSSGECLVQPSWEQGSLAPLCDGDPNKPKGQGEEYSAACGAGECVACQDGEPGCKAAKCVPKQGSGGTGCEFSDLEGGNKVCAAIQGEGESLVCTTEGECHQVCYTWAVPCLDCLSVETNNNTLATNLIGLINSYLQQYISSSNGTDLFTKFLAPNSDEMIWRDFVDVCVPQVFPRFMPPAEISGANAALEAMGLCAGVFLEKVPEGTQLMMEYGQNSENLSYGLAAALMGLMTADGLCQACGKETGVYSCNTFSATGIPQTEPACSDELGLDVVGVGYGQWTYFSPYCVRLCEVDAGAPLTVCDGQSCVEP